MVRAISTTRGVKMRVVSSDTEEEEEEEEAVEILDGTEVGTDDELDGEDQAIAEENGAQYDSALNLEQEPATIEETRCLLRIFEKVGVQNFAVPAAESGRQSWRTIFNRRMSMVETAREFAFSSKWTPEARELFNCAHSMRKISVFNSAEVEIIRSGSGRCMFCGTKCADSREVYALLGNANATRTCLPVRTRRPRANSNPSRCQAPATAPRPGAVRPLTICTTCTRNTSTGTRGLWKIKSQAPSHSKPSLATL